MIAIKWMTGLTYDLDSGVWIDSQPKDPQTNTLVDSPSGASSSYSEQPVKGS